MHIWTKMNVQQNKTHYVNHFCFIIHEIVPDKSNRKPCGLESPEESQQQGWFWVIKI